MVLLISPFDSDRDARAIGAIAKTFKLSAVSDDKSLFDVIQATANVKSREDLASKLSNYENKAINSGTVITRFWKMLTKIKGSHT